MQTAPSIALVDTKQIIPDKNIFGQSNPFNVVIQMASRRQSKSDRHNINSNKSNSKDVIAPLEVMSLSNDDRLEQGVEGLSPTNVDADVASALMVGVIDQHGDENPTTGDSHSIPMTEEGNVKD